MEWLDIIQKDWNYVQFHIKLEPWSRKYVLALTEYMYELYNTGPKVKRVATYHYNVGRQRLNNTQVEIFAFAIRQRRSKTFGNGKPELTCSEMARRQSPIHWSKTHCAHNLNIPAALVVGVKGEWDTQADSRGAWLDHCVTRAILIERQGFQW